MESDEREMEKPDLVYWLKWGILRQCPTKCCLPYL